MEDIYLMIWNETNRFVGIEEQVLIRRRHYALQESLVNRAVFSRNSIKYISSGSTAEGMSLPGSDIDDMLVLNHISVSCSDNGLVSESDIIMDTTDIKPGFVRLRCRGLIDEYPLSLAMTETNNGLFLSSLVFRDFIVHGVRSSIPSAVGHGPCVTYVLPSKVENDMLCCFPCKIWPGVAVEWIDRYRNNNWPPRDLLTDIVNEGCLIVPIGNPHSEESHIQWRISFSTAEKKLVHSMNHCQFLCYGLLKLYHKYVINSNLDVMDLLCSYFLKTALFYCIEDEHIVWNKENFIDCFWTCFRRLIKWVRDEYCPNFFIKENNMFEGKVCGEKGRILLRYLIEIYHDGLYSLFRIPCLSSLHVTTMDRPVLTGGVLTDAEREYLCDKEIVTAIAAYTSKEAISCMKFLKVNAEMIETSTSSIDKTLLTMEYHMTISHFVQLLYKDIVNNGSNKNTYKRRKELKSFILHNCMDSDRCTGLLLLATLCYLNCEYKNVVTILRKVVKILKSCTFFWKLSGLYLYNKQRYIDQMCGKGLTLNQKLACHIFAQCYKCKVDCKMYPSEIEAEVVQYSTLNVAWINPVLYCYMMLFLSYLHTNERGNMSNALNELCKTVYDRDTFHELEAPFAMSVLARCIQLFKSWQNNHGNG